MHRATFLGFVCLFSAPFASEWAFASDIPGNSSTTATLSPDASREKSRIDFARDVDWYRVELEKNHDYFVYGQAFSPTDTLVVDIRGPGGKLLAQGFAPTGRPGGFDFRAPKTGTYFVEYRDAYSFRLYRYGAAIVSDCGLFKRTRCTLRLGEAHTGALNGFRDIDAYNVVLRRNDSYIFSVSPRGKGILVEVYDPMTDQVVSDVDQIKFKANRSGRYQVGVVSGSTFSGKYQLLGKETGQ